MPKAASVLFVCMGNICRSPAAEGLFRAFVADQPGPNLVEIDSAGTHGYHIGAMADPRMREAADRRGHQLNSRARRIIPVDLQSFDLVIAMDRENQLIINNLDEGDQATRNARVCLFSDFLDDSWPTDVPDPYYGGEQGFEMVLDMIEAGCPAIYQSLSEQT